tara:strand:+ start:186 stop:1103 length:918 start_codon:yes stop_codon:yes gene_type:complete
MRACDGHHAPRHGRQPVRKVERITTSDFDGESRRHRKVTTARAKSLAGALENYLKAETKKQVRRIIQEMRQNGPRSFMPVKKANGEDGWDEERLLKIIALYGVRQIIDSGREIAGSTWALKPAIRDTYLFQKQVLVQRIPKNLEKEMRGALGRALGTWFVDEPGLTVQQISARLRSWITVPSAAETPYALKPLGKRFTPEGLGARARMIARTEINQARNRGRLEAGKSIGTEYWIWLAETDGLSGDRQHDALDGQVRQTGEAFVNPATGAVLEYPGDAGAEASEIINCRCSIRPLTADQAKQFGV